MSKILIVDDERDFCLSLKKYFSSKGFSVFIASSAKEGIKLFENEKPDVTLLDIKMPGMDGIDAIKNLREIHPLAKIIIVTGIASERLKNTLLNAGVIAYITKPVNLQDLHKLIQGQTEKGVE